MPNQYVIADIHGCLHTFETLLDKLAFSQSDELYLLGDYIDRGWSSKGVIDAILSFQQQGYKIYPQRGNHEQMLINGFIAEQKQEPAPYLCQRFLDSFNISRLLQLPSTYLDFCQQLPYYQQVGKFLLVHGGLSFEQGDPFLEGDLNDLMWVRDWYENINFEWLEDRIVLHGHTPQPMMQTKTQLKHLQSQQVLNLDNGAFMSRHIAQGYGVLTAFDMNNRTLIQQKNVDTDNIY